MKPPSQFRSEFRTDRRTVIGGGLGLAGGAGLAVAAAPAGIARVTAQQVTPAASTAEPGTIRVVGSGAVPLSPDAASVVVGIDVSAPELADAQAEAAATMEAILAAISDQGIPDAAVQTAGFSVYPVRSYDQATGVPGAVVSFQVSNTVNVLIRDIDEVSPLLDAVVAAGANVIYGVTFFIENPGEVASEARRKAIRDARTKAQTLAEAAGLRLGRIVGISEAGSSVGPLYGSAMGGAQAAEAIAPGTSSVATSVEVIFELGA